MPETMSFNVEDFRAPFVAAGQEHVFDFIDQLSPRERARLGKDLSKVDLTLLKELQELAQAAPQNTPNEAEPAPMLELQEQEFPWTPHVSLVEAEERGKELLRAGKVAVVVVAGGQGTRLGFNEPKGLYPLWPKSRKLLFQGFAEQLLAIKEQYGKAPKLYVMTSSDTDAATCAAFMSAEFFGLDHDDVYFFKQGKLPSLTPEGKLILRNTHRIAFNPDGHGGVFQALKKRKCLDEMRADGVEYLFYCQVDNPFVRLAEPAFIGALAKANADLGVKAVRKEKPGEKVGVIGLRDGKPTIVEYSELSDSDAGAREGDGSLKWKAGNTAIHGFSLDFMERIAEGPALPLHRAKKAVPFVDDKGETVTPTSPNALKFERFIFDAFAQAEGLLNVECAREAEFLPIKSGSGPTSPDRVRKDMQYSFQKALKGLCDDRTRFNDASKIEIPPALWADFERLKRALADESIDFESPKA